MKLWPVFIWLKKEIKPLNEKKIIPSVSNAATTVLSKKFEGNQHNLSWPVASGSIAMHFGLQVIPPNHIKIDLDLVPQNKNNDSNKGNIITLYLQFNETDEAEFLTRGRGENSDSPE